MTRDDIGRWAEEQAAYNESFSGDEINEQKLAKLNKMKKMCQELARLDSHIEAPFRPFDKTCRNGKAQILLPYVHTIDGESALNILALLSAQADCVSFAALNGEKIIITYTVLDMWDEFHHDGYDVNI